MKIARKFMAFVISFAMLFGTFSPLLSNVAYANGDGEDVQTYKIKFQNALPGNDQYTGEGEYDVIHWEFAREDEQNPGTEYVFCRMEEKNDQNEWRTINTYSVDNQSVIANLTVNKGESVSEKYRIRFDDITDRFNILKDGNKLTQGEGYIVTEERETLINTIENGMNIDISRRVVKEIEFNAGGALQEDSQTILYNVDNKDVSLKLGTISQGVFTPINIVDISESDDVLCQIENSYNGYYLNVDAEEGSEYELIINGNNENVRIESGYVDLSAFDQQGKISVCIQGMNQGGPNNPGGEPNEEKIVEFSDGDFDEDNNRVVYTLKEHNEETGEETENTVSIQIGKLNDQDEFVPVQINRSVNQENPQEVHIEAHFNDESKQFTGYYLKVDELPQNIRYELYIDDRVETNRIDNEGLVNLDGITNNFINVWINNEQGEEPNEMKSAEFFGATLENGKATYKILEEDEETGNEVEKTVTAQIVKLNESGIYIPTEIDSHTDENGNLRVQTEFEDESKEFRGYYIKVENQENANIKLLVNGREEGIDNGLYSLEGRRDNHLDIEIVDENWNPDFGNSEATIKVSGGDGSYQDGDKEVPYSESYIEAIFAINDGPLESIGPNDEKVDIVTGKKYAERPINYGDEEENDSIIISFGAEKGKKYVGTVVINGESYNVDELIDYNNKYNLLKHFRDSFILFDIEVPKSNDNRYEIVLNLEPIGNDINLDELELSAAALDELMDQMERALEQTENLEMEDLFTEDGLNRGAEALVEAASRENGALDINFLGNNAEERVANAKLLLSTILAEDENEAIIIAIDVEENPVNLSEENQSIIDASEEANGNAKVFYNINLIVKVEKNIYGEKTETVIGTKSKVRIDANVLFNVGNDEKEILTSNKVQGKARHYYAYAIHNGKVTRIPAEFNEETGEIKFTTKEFSVFGLGYEDEKDKYTVTFESNGGSAVPAQELNYGQRVNKPENPTREDGKKFGDWYTDKELTQKFSFGTEIDKDITLYAKWNAVYSVLCYDLDENLGNKGGKVNGFTNLAGYIYKGESTTLTAVPDENMEFVEWIIEKDGDTYSTQSEIVLDYDNVGELNLYAIFRKARFTVTFNTNGGNKIDSQTVLIGENAQRPENPVRGPRTFMGWYKDEELKEEFDFNTPISANVTVYAKWSDAVNITSVDNISNKTYTGKALTPAVKVKYENQVLVKDKDYTVKYSSNKNIGTATVTVTGIGNYKGTIKKTFKINPKGTSISKLTAAKKGFTAKWKKQATQTTGYQIRYSLKSSMGSATTKTITSNKTLSKKVTKLKAKKKYYVQVRTYKTVGKVKYYSGWSTKKTVTTKK